MVFWVSVYAGVSRVTDPRVNPYLGSGIPCQDVARLWL